MALPTIAVINFVPALNDNDVREAIHAVNRQVLEHFTPIWGYGRTLDLFIPNFEPTDPNTLAEEFIPADSVMYLVDEATLPGALGFHDLNTRDVPYGFVFVLDPNDWTTTLSHETLELVLDPTANVLVPGPDPRDENNTVLHSYEACDAVERLSYPIGDILVSDFVTPSYFTVGEAAGARNDFLGVGVPSFGVTRGSHIAFFDLSTGQEATVVGAEMPARRSLARRAKLHDHPKPTRPAEETLEEQLKSYQGGKQRPGCSGLKHLRGITRTARYREATGRLGTMLAAVRG